LKLNQVRRKKEENISRNEVKQQQQQSHYPQPRIRGRLEMKHSKRQINPRAARPLVNSQAEAGQR